MALGDWPEMRGPQRDGVSTETGLIEKWALNGENFLWRAPYGGRSAPIVMGNRVYVQNPSGRGAALQERVMCARRRHRQGGLGIQVQHLPERRAAAPRRLGLAGRRPRDRQHLRAGRRRARSSRSSKDGKLLWERSIGEEFAAFTTHGGRTTSPLIDGDLVIVSAAISNWGALRRAAAPLRRARQAHRRHRLRRDARAAGRTTPNYSAPVIATINGMRLLICGSGDGGVHAIKPQTGEKVWSFVAAKRADQHRRRSSAATT